MVLNFKFLMRLQSKMISKIILISPIIFYSQNNPEKLMDSDKEIKSKSYEVIETIRTAFGRTKVVYVVSNKNMIDTYDLGPNNTREVREIIVYKKAREKKYYTGLNLQAKDLKEVNGNTNVISDQEIVNPNKSITIIPIETYERLVEQGIRSSELYSQLADAYFYKNDYAKASKYYFEFFTIEKRIKPEFYLRYAVTLDKLGQKEKSKVLLMTYEALLKNQKIK
ncbi:hypothetical protein FLB_11150 [Flavobacterium succinicans]|uniref:Tetratricopeptide repeat protein n=2 Tax=Flavobacterium succinicans TaxID=29536 RepID=A0A199XT23_9FLAO|nr:hypothetical protein FLB_11150 [Flavobacterium succinicans]